MTFPEFLETITPLQWAMFAVLALAVMLCLVAAADWKLPREPLPRRPLRQPESRPDNFPRPTTLADTPRAYRPRHNRPPPQPQWLGGDQSQGWWIWDKDQAT